jgi:hypothetical protein
LGIIVAALVIAQPRGLREEVVERLGVASRMLNAETMQRENEVWRLAGVSDSCERAHSSMRPLQRKPDRQAF